MTKIEGYTFAGKTGTAQKKTADSTGYAEGQYVGSFIGFGPLEDPQFLVLIVVDAPSGSYYGAQVAAPVFKDLMTEIVRMKGLRPTSDTGLKPSAPVVTAPPRVIPPVHQTEDGVLIPSLSAGVRGKSMTGSMKPALALCPREWAMPSSRTAARQLCAFRK